MNVLIINGPNLNLLGTREPGIYGSVSFDEYLEKLRKEFPMVEIGYFQSNIEGEIIDELQRADGVFDAVILNAAGYTHTSVAIADAVAAISTPVVEVHISQPASREEFRRISLIAPYCRASVSGFGLDSYRLAFEGILQMAT